MEPSCTTLRILSPLLHGVDVVEIEEMRRLACTDLHTQLTTIFSPAEMEVCGVGLLQVERLASRLAIKEAVLKALGLGFGDGVSFLDVETETSSTGAPSVQLHRSVELAAIDQGVTAWLVSATHTSTVAFASAIGVRNSQ